MSSQSRAACLGKYPKSQAGQEEQKVGDSAYKPVVVNVTEEHRHKPRVNHARHFPA